MITEMLGLKAEGFDRRLRVCSPILPAGVPALEVHDMKVAGARVSLRFEQHGDRVKIIVLNQDGVLDVVGEPSVSTLLGKNMLSSALEDIALDIDRGGIGIALIGLIRGCSSVDRVQLSKQSSGGAAHV
jgi:hypothetical protein